LSDFEKEKDWKFEVDDYGVNLSNIALWGEDKGQDFVKWFQGVILDADLYERKGKNKNSRVVNRPETGVILRLN